MHIPDGFIAPQVYIPMYIVDIGLIAYGFNKLKDNLGRERFATLSVLSALSFVLMSITFPLPGGTSVHITGITILSVLLGYWVSFVCVSIVLFIQAAIFGEGGITSFPVNSIGIAFIGSIASYYTFNILKRFLNQYMALFISGWLSLNLSALFIGFTLGLQPIIAHDTAGKPLFFPFGFSIAVPAVVIPHLFAGIIEGIYTVFIYKVLKSKGLTDV
ncbi:MAG: energy-coupling factor ABC transporter permease [Hydrogenothermaceae bacterium]|nr:energy-coupling factor ABC transporter permease [Hydrogenothermaceae bacterium]